MDAVVNTTMMQPLPRIKGLPAALPLDNAVRIELAEGVPVFKAPYSVQKRIETLLTRKRQSRIIADEEKELDRYEEIDDYLSFVNRVIRNLIQAERVKEA
ncbi:MAG: hypothetical protein ABIG63_10540 [Chloroflexota bacterium]